MKDIEKLKEQYKVYCIINNLAENKQGFRYYLQDQAMLARVKKLKSKK